MFWIKLTESKEAHSANLLTRRLSTAHMVPECWFSLSGRRRCHGKSDCYPLGVQEVCSWRRAAVRGLILRDLSEILYTQGAHTYCMSARMSAYIQACIQTYTQIILTDSDNPENRNFCVLFSVFNSFGKTQFSRPKSLRFIFWEP